MLNAYYVITIYHIYIYIYVYIYIYKYIYIISLLKKTCERFQILFKEEIEKNNNMVVKDIKIFQKLKNKSLLSIGKKYEKE